MKPAPGRYRFHVNLPGGGTSDVEYRVSDAGCVTTFGTMPWDAAGDCFRLGAIALECTGVGTFVGVNASLVPPGTYTGTCEFLGP